MSGKPTLHEIAAMPYSQTADAVRRHYDPDWGKVTEDGEPSRIWRVRFRWTISGTFDDEIEADSEQEAREIAQEWARDDAYSADFEAGHMKVTPVESAPQ